MPGGPTDERGRPWPRELQKRQAGTQATKKESSVSADAVEQIHFIVQSWRLLVRWGSPAIRGQCGLVSHRPSLHRRGVPAGARSRTHLSRRHSGRCSPGSNWLFGAAAGGSRSSAREWEDQTADDTHGGSGWCGQRVGECRARPRRGRWRSHDACSPIESERKASATE